jgi:CheY-like chemotaxis protein
MPGSSWSDALDMPLRPTIIPMRPAVKRLFQLPKCMPVAFILLAGLVCCLALASITTLREQAIDEEIARLDSSSAAIADNAAGQLHALATLLEELAHDIAAQQAAGKDVLDRHVGSPGFRRLLAQCVSTTPGVAMVAVVDAAGNTAVTSEVLAPSRNNSAIYDFFPLHRSDRTLDILFSRAREIPDSTEAAFYASRRLAGPDGRFLGVVLAKVPMHAFLSLWHRMEMEQYATLQLFRPGRRLVAQYPDDGRALVDASATPATSRALLSNLSMALGEDLPSLTVVRQLKPFALSLAVSATDFPYLLAWRRTARLILAAASSSMIIAAFFLIAAPMRIRRRAAPPGAAPVAGASAPCQPATAAALPPAMAPALHGPGRPGAPLGRQAGARILLVEDNEANRFIATVMLADLGFVVDTACDGKQALEAHMANVFDLILMDLSMPVMSGSESTRAIRRWERAQARQPAVTIIALSANTLDETGGSLLDAGMDDFITKPYKRAELKAMLDKWLAIHANALPASPAQAATSAAPARTDIV